MIPIRGRMHREPEDAGDAPPPRWRDIFPADYQRPRPPRPEFDGSGQWWKRISYWWTYSRDELEALARAYL